MAKVIEITNPLTGRPQQMWQSDYTAQQIDDRLTILSGENLLDNVNFCNPVNQRGVSGTISTAGFFIDRWYLVSGSAQLTSAGLVLNGTMRQTREFAVGAPTTASALTTTGIVTASYDDSTRVFTLTGTGQTFVTAKLELGNVSTVGYYNSNDVLVPANIPNKGIEELKCKRFLLIYPDFQYPFAFQAVNANSIVGSLAFPVTMSENPQIQITKFRCLNDGKTASVSGATYFGDNTGISAINNGQSTGDFTEFTQGNWYSFDLFASCEI